MLKEFDPTEALYIIESGEVEIFLEISGEEFVLERLGQGSVINHRVIFLEDVMVVNIRATKPTFVRFLFEDDINQFKIGDDELIRIIGLYESNLMKRGTSYPLDYIKHSHDDDERRKNYRHFVLKTVVLRQIEAIRIIQRKPKLRDLLDLCRGYNKDYVLVKIRALFGKSTEEINEDKKFEDISSRFERLNKTYVLQNDMIQGLDERVSALFKRRMNRER